ncbi:MAG: hypothetical protein WKG06_05255 [Segetibacter sp.]
MISSLCYNYFRTGNAITNKTIEERLLTSLFLCTDVPNEILQNEKPGWNEKVVLPLAEKISIADMDAENIFPFNNDLSEDINTKAFNTSFLIKPKLFARLRHWKTKNCKTKT